MSPPPPKRRLRVVRHLPSPLGEVDAEVEVAEVAAAIKTGQRLKAPTTKIEDLITKRERRVVLKEVLLLLRKRASKEANHNIRERRSTSQAMSTSTTMMRDQSTREWRSLSRASFQRSCPRSNVSRTLTRPSSKRV